MNHIDKHLRELLFQLEKVSVKGLGTFVTFQTPARINEEQQIIEPPRKGVRFNNSIETDEDYFTTFISERENLSRVQALELIDSYVENMNKEVLQNIGYTLQGIGTFIEGNNQSLRFIPDPKANFNTQTYGLGDVNLPEKKEIVEEKIEEKKIPEITPSAPKVIPPPVTTTTPPPTPSYSTSTMATATTEKQSVGDVLESNVDSRQQEIQNRQEETLREEVNPQAPEFEYDDDSGSSSKFKTWIPAIAIVFLSGFLLLQLNRGDSSIKNTKPFSFIFGDDEKTTTKDDNKLGANGDDVENISGVDDGEEDYETTTDNTTTDNTDNANVEDDYSNDYTAETKPDDNFTQNQPTNVRDYENETDNTSNYSESTYNSNAPVTINTQENMQSGFYGAVGVFSVKNNAIKLANKLKKQGFEAYIIQNGNRFRTVIGLNTNSEPEAEQKLQRIKREVNKDAWLLKV